MKKLFFGILILVLTGHLASAQITYTQAGIGDLVGQVNWMKKVNPGSPDIQGSPYLTDEFIDGVIYFDKKYKIEKVPLRINLYNDDMEFKEKNVTMAIADPKRVDKIEMGEYTFIYLEEKKKSKVDGFVYMRNSEYPSIITKMEMDFLKKEEAKPYVEPKPDRFVRGHDKHYLMSSESEIVKISSVKKLIQALGDHQSELSEYAKKEKISSGKVEELVELVEYYHSLK